MNQRGWDGFVWGEVHRHYSVFSDSLQVGGHLNVNDDLYMARGDSSQLNGWRESSVWPAESAHCVHNKDCETIKMGNSRSRRTICA